MATKVFTTLKKKYMWLNAQKLARLAKEIVLSQQSHPLKEATKLYLEEWTLAENKLLITTTFEASYAQIA